MDWRPLLRKILFGQIVSLIGLAVLLFEFSATQASKIYLYEVLGALTASALTVFGLLEMKKLTSD